MVFMAAILAMTSIPYNNCINSEIMDLACWEYGKSPLRAIGTLTLFIVFLLLFLLTRSIVTNLIRSLTKRTNEKAAADYKRYRAEVEREAQKLAKIRASMTEAEWAAYEIQLENKRLLEEIKDNQGKTGGTTSRFIYGVIDD
jgi:flagellar biosynthesis/type III secretory pathway M-ring protein FliF/YscJ